MDGGDWLDFAAAVLPTLLWVSMIAVVVFMLRGPITSALASGNLKRAKFGPTGADLEWYESKLDEVERDLSQAESQPEPDGLDKRLAVPPWANDASSSDESEDYYAWGASDFLAPDRRQDVGVDNPTAMVMNAYASLESLMQLVLREDKRTFWSASRSAADMASDLLRHGIINPSLYNSVRSLTDIRNEVAHNRNPDLSLSEARRFADTAHKVELALIRTLGSSGSARPSDAPPSSGADPGG